MRPKAGRPTPQSLSDTAKPFKGVEGGGVFEIALKHRSDAFRVLYVVEFEDALWVVDALQKKSKTGIKTPKVDVERIRGRVRQLKDMQR